MKYNLIYDAILLARGFYASFCCIYCYSIQCKYAKLNATYQAHIKTKTTTNSHKIIMLMTKIYGLNKCPCQKHNSLPNLITCTHHLWTKFFFSENTYAKTPSLHMTNKKVEKCCSLMSRLQYIMLSKF